MTCKECLMSLTILSALTCLIIYAFTEIYNSKKVQKVRNVLLTMVWVLIILGIGLLVFLE